MDFSRLSWKTASAGIAAIAGGVTGFIFGISKKNLTPELCTAYITSILSGLGLLFARDNDKSSTDVGIQSVEPKAQAKTVVTPDKP
jgi:hypothetical protein